jgi:exonuclease III
MKILSFNVNGLRSFFTYHQQHKTDIRSFLESFDIVCLQETKLSSQESARSVCQDSGGSIMRSFPHRFFANSRSKSGYSGVAVFCKTLPIMAYEGFTGLLWSPSLLARAEESGEIPILCNKEEEEEEASTVSLESLDSEGRTIILDFGPFLLVNAYFPNEDRNIKGFKMAFHLAMENFCKVRTS